MKAALVKLHEEAAKRHQRALLHLRETERAAGLPETRTTRKAEASGHASPRRVPPRDLAELVRRGNNA